jgi:1,2-phenylacetyl-CoA epoxidase PaaB subunit
MLTPETLLSPMGLLWDEVMMSRHYASKPGTCTNAYMRIQQWHSGDGAAIPRAKSSTPPSCRSWTSCWRMGHCTCIKSIRNSFTRKDPSSIWVVFASNGAEGQDAFKEAVEDMQKNHPETAAAYSTLITAKGHRDALYRLDL